MSGGRQIQGIVGFLLCSLLMIGCAKAVNIDPPFLTQLSVGLEEKFELRRGQSAALAGSGLEIEILKFFNRPCPPNVRCVWSGIGIEFEYRISAQSRRGINLVRAFGYKVSVIESDYESYAVLKISQDKDR